MPLRGPVSVRHCTRANSEKISLGPATIYLLEDGSSTDTRVGCMLMELPPGTAGPPMHWHRFHDECFLVTRGTVTFATPEGDVSAGVGEMVVVPPRAVHTFRNASLEVEAEFYMTATPGYYIDYFRALGKVTSTGQQVTEEQTKHLMELFGTFPPDVESEP
ncbi:RmlC-like cupin domain-containing protein [Whalleya microplaca]|nr:RmlC-like cupin domain-containing protein [Whalleya microplaca]